MGTALKVTADNIHLWRGERHLLRGASFIADAGQLVQLTGANGSGKTTLLRVLAGLTRPEEGHVRWDCDDTLTWQGARGRIAFLGHKDALDDALSVEENIRYSVAMAGARVVNSVLKQTLANLNLEAQAALQAKALSAGQRRRTALARVFMSSMPAWLLDEPYTHLDEQGRGLLNRHIEAQLSGGGLVVLTTHEEGSLPRAPDLRVAL